MYINIIQIVYAAAVESKVYVSYTAFFVTGKTKTDITVPMQVSIRIQLGMK